jgi:phosphoribosylamine--glycine ligase
LAPRLGVGALGDRSPAARLQADKAVKRIGREGAWCRKDISDKAIGVAGA